MDAMTLVLLGGLAYLLLVPQRAPSGAGNQAVYASAPGQGFSVSVPGLGGYRTGPGGTILTLDPSLFGRGQPPTTGVPVPTMPFAPSDSPTWPAGSVPLPDILRDRPLPVDPLNAYDTAPIDPTPDPSAFYPPDPGSNFPVDLCAVDPSACYDDWSWVTG